MNDVAEQTAFDSVVGLRLKMDRLDKIASSVGKGRGGYGDCVEYCIEMRSCLDEELLHRFRITAAQIQKWKQNNIVFRIYLYVHEGKLIGGRIQKFKLTEKGSSFPLNGYLTEPTSQEIRITGRILRYLCDKTTKR